MLEHMRNFSSPSLVYFYLVEKVESKAQYRPIKTCMSWKENLSEAKKRKENQIKSQLRPISKFRVV